MPPHAPGIERGCSLAKFLSEEWQEQARSIRDELGPDGGSLNQKVKMNLVVNEVPSDVADGPIDAHLDTTGGDLGLDTGHLSDADLTLSLDYESAKKILVDGDASAGMQAFMAGKIQVMQGDMSTLMTIQSGFPALRKQPIGERIAAITD